MIGRNVAPVRSSAFRRSFAPVQDRLKAELRTRIAIILPIALLFGACAHADWPTYHGNFSLDGYADVALPEKLAQAWKFEAGARIPNTPVVGEGRIYFADGKGVVHALDFAGKELWSKALTFPDRKGIAKPMTFDAPLVFYASTIIAGSAEGVVFALDAKSGDVKWTLNTDLPILGTPTIAEIPVDGKKVPRLYVIDESNGVLQCIDFATGKMVWTTDGLARCDGSPASNAEVIVFGSCASAMHIFSTTEPKKLREVALDQDSQIAGGIVLLGNDMYSGCRSGQFIHADARDAKVLWMNKDCTGEAMSTPAVGPERIVFGANDSTFYCLKRADGALLWKTTLDDTPSSPVIARDKVVLTANGKLHILALSDGKTLQSFAVSDTITSPALAGSLVLVGADDGSVTAFK